MNVNETGHSLVCWETMPTQLTSTFVTLKRNTSMLHDYQYIDAYIISLPRFHASKLSYCVCCCWKTLQQTVEVRKPLPFHDGVLINDHISYSFNDDEGYYQHLSFFYLILQKIRSFHCMSFADKYDTRRHYGLLSSFSWFSFKAKHTCLVPQM